MAAAEGAAPAGACGHNLPSTPLHAAITQQRWDLVPVLLDAGSDVSIQNCCGFTPLCSAINHAAPLRIINMLSETGNVDARMRRLGYTPLHMAALHCRWDVVFVLLENGADANLHVPAGVNTHLFVLHLAVQNQQWRTVHELLAHGAHPNVSTSADLGSRTSLHVALTAGAPRHVISALTTPYTVNRQDRNQETPLHVAVRMQDWDSVRTFMDNGADATIRDIGGLTPLHSVIWREDPLSNIKLLMTEQSVNATNPIEHTPLHIAVQLKQWSVVQALVERGVDVEKVHPHVVIGCTYLLQAFQFDDVPEAVVECLATPAIINTQNHESSQTALHIAAKGKRWQVLELLLAKGADSAITDNSGQTALHIAMHGGCGPDQIKLLANSVSVNVVDNMHNTALYYAYVDRQWDNVEVLVELGADPRIGNNGGRGTLVDQVPDAPEHIKLLVQDHHFVEFDSRAQK